MKKIGIILIIVGLTSGVFRGNEGNNIINIVKEKISENEYIKADTSNNNLIDGVLLVNDNYILDSDYIPEKLVEANIPFVLDSIEEERLLDEKVAKAVESLFHEAEEDGIILLGTSGYRSYKTQNKVYKEEAIKNGKKYAEAYVALPGSSEHQTGLCIDVTNEGRYFGGETKEAIWLAENAHKFGFIIRFPEGKEKITGKEYEPWHIRYVGKNKAKDIYEKGITLEEYLLN